jgi:outer membrane protein TolC
MRAHGIWITVMFLLLAKSAWGQSSAPYYASSPSNSSTSSNSPSVSTPTAPQAQSPYFQSVPGQPVPGVLKISLLDAIDRGLKHNLGLLLSDDATLDARGKRWQELSHLLPSVNGTVSEHLEQIDLASYGFSFPGSPTIVGPFGYFDARAFYSQPIFDLHAINNVRSRSQYIQAAQYTYKDARELVVLAVGLNYLQTISDAARLETAKAQTQTAQALYDQASDQLKAGTSADIDALRAQVEFQTQQQQMISARNSLEKQKLALARVIGLPPGQEFEITDAEPYDAFTPATLEEELQKAYTLRSDLKSARANVRAAEYALKAAKEQYAPSVLFNADYGDIGINPGNSHGTVDVAGTLRIPIFDGGQTHGDVLRAQATLKQNQQQLENIKAQIDQDVRDALLDLQSSAQQVQVARSNNDLANQTLAQAKDRFAAGVTNNIEVVQAQQSVATASESYISSLFNYNYAKISLARAVGSAEQGVKDYLKGKQ